MRRASRSLIALVVLAIGALLAGLVPALADKDAPDALPRVAFVARSDLSFDALAAAPVAGALGGVVILTEPDSWSQAADDALHDFRPTQVYVTGGSAAISDSVVDAIRAADDDDPALNWDVDRVFGSSREATAKALADLPAQLGYDRPVLLDSGGNLPLMWGDAYSQDSHDHGINPGAAGDAGRAGGVVDGSDILGTDVATVAELTVKSSQLNNNCIGQPGHNLLVEASGTFFTKGGDDATGEVALTVDDDSWPAGDESTRTVDVPAEVTDASFASHRLFTGVAEGSDHTVRLLAQRSAGSDPLNVDGTLVVEHLGYECAP